MCRELCKRFKAKIDVSLRQAGIGPFLQGFVKCSKCEIFIDMPKENNPFLINGVLQCLCCHSKLKVKPSNNKWKQRDKHIKKVAARYNISLEEACAKVDGKTEVKPEMIVVIQ